MNKKQTNPRDYISPSVETVDLSSESVLCASDPQPWYKQGGQGDFDYSIEEEEGWM